MTEATFNAMWSAVEKGKGKLLDYFAAKAALLGLDRLSFYDLKRRWAKRTRKKFRTTTRRISSSSSSAASARACGIWPSPRSTKAGLRRKDRPGKSAGGFCTSFPLSGQSRIFMTYGGRSSSVDTLAHELFGHEYHFHVMRDLPPLAREYPMNLAENHVHAGGNGGG